MVIHMDVEGDRPWQLNVRSFNAGIAHVSKSGEFSDLSFFVGPKKREFKAHRLFMAAKSPQLLNIVVKEGDVLPQVSKIYLPDVSEDAFEILLNYINTSVIHKMDSQDLVLDVYQASITYGQNKLQEECEKLIKKWDINCENVIPMLQRTDLKFVQDLCWEFLKIHARTVLQSDGIRSAMSSTLVDIFEKGYFTGIPTMELLTKIVGWSANHYGLESKEKLIGNKEKNRTTSYKVVRNDLLIPHGEKSKCLMSWIGFQNLSPKELSKVSGDYPGLLTDEEFKIFVVNEYAEGEKPALPEWA